MQRWQHLDELPNLSRNSWLMRRIHCLLSISLATLGPVLSVFVLLCAAPAASAQRHSAGTSPPTAPPSRPAAQLIMPVSSGMGALQFVSVNYGVPAPQSLSRQLQAEDDRTRASSLSAIGAPGQYLNHGHVPYPHSVDLQFVALGTTDELDAILTVELDQHIVTAILLPEDGNWHRVATVLYPISFGDTTITPSTFLRVARSLVQHDRYNAVFHATSYTPTGDYIENEAQLRVFNGRAVISINFASSARNCEATPAKQARTAGCEVMHRWLQPDPADPTHHFLLVSGSGHLSAHDAADPIAGSRTFQLSHLRTFACQSYAFSDANAHFEPVANSAPCHNPH